MRGRMFGLLFAVAVVLLMLSALVVAGAEPPEEAPLPKQAMLTAAPPQPSGQDEIKADRVAIPLVLPCLATPIPPSADANGTVINTTYLRANFTAFHLSDSAG